MIDDKFMDALVTSIKNELKDNTHNTVVFHVNGVPPYYQVSKVILERYLSVHKGRPIQFCIEAPTEEHPVNTFHVRTERISDMTKTFQDMYL